MNIKYKEKFEVGDKVRVLTGDAVNWCDADCRSGEEGVVINEYDNNGKEGYAKLFIDYFGKKPDSTQILTIKTNNVDGWRIPAICVQPIS